MIDLSSCKGSIENRAQWVVGTCKWQVWDGDSCLNCRLPVPRRCPWCLPASKWTGFQALTAVAHPAGASGAAPGEDAGSAPEGAAQGLWSWWISWACSAADGETAVWTGRGSSFRSASALGCSCCTRRRPPYSLQLRARNENDIRE